MNAPPIHGHPAITVLDAVALARLQELDPGGKAGIVRRVMSTFDQSLATALDNLQKALERADAVEIRRLAHTLKSSSASVGALALSSACAETEALARDQRLDELPAAVARLLSEGQGALAAVRDLLHG